MNELEWKSIYNHTLAQMTEHLEGTAVPLTKSDGEGRGIALGTANRIRLLGNDYLITNQHVVDEADGLPIGYLPGNDIEYIQLTGFIHTARTPIDIALCKISQNKSKTLAASDFDDSFSPEDNELFFWIGYPGTTAGYKGPVTELKIRRTHFGIIDTPQTPFLIQRDNSLLRDTSYNDDIHFHFPYPENGYRNNNLEELPFPKGMSGSLLWDTKRVACLRHGVEWTPAKAKVCGIVRTRLANRLTGTKIEHVSNALLHFMRSDKAYFHWIDRGRLNDDSLLDWVYAEKQLERLY